MMTEGDPGRGERQTHSDEAGPLSPPAAVVLVSNC